MSNMCLTLFPLIFFFCRLNMIAVWDKSDGRFSMLQGDAEAEEDEDDDVSE